MASARIMEMSITCKEEEATSQVIWSMQAAQTPFLLQPHLDFRAVFHLVLLGDCVCDYNCLKTGVVDSGNSWPRKDPVSQDGINFSSTS